MSKAKSTMQGILQELEEQKMRKLRSKLPSWASAEGLQLPASLALEQCSSEQAALFKASLLASLLPESASIADFTGGFGVDSWAFSQFFGKVHYFERDAELASIFVHNIGLLPHKAELCCRNAEITAEFLEQLTREGFRSDCIFLDPARRSREGSKVFLLEDCSPNVLELLGQLAQLAPRLMLKLSPMADITMLLSRLQGNEGGYRVQSLYIVGLKHEVKELLLVLEKEDMADVGDGTEAVRAEGGAAAGALNVFAVNNGIVLNVSELQTARKVTMQAEDGAAAVWREGGAAGKLTEGAGSAAEEDHSQDLRAEDEKSEYLLEADAILLKAAASSLATELLGARKIASQSKLYLCGKALDKQFGHPLLNFYKIFRLEECLPFNKENVRELARSYPRLEVSSSLPGLSSEELQKRMKVCSGIAPEGKHYHLFACIKDSSKSLLLCSTATL